uniref:acylphosphatase-2-like isoform X1 n=1 Tax=Oncorhynchus gorbuscha TaxID=8017 RepID=UPI001EAF5AD0|nr:acylphosphatase-2-like isoform X1 [Oncorhynchus gorbuscha]
MHVINDSNSIGSLIMVPQASVTGHQLSTLMEVTHLRWQYTEKEGLRLGLCGWVKNTNKGTVVGQVQGPADMICEMKVWLCKEGSPSCSITRASFSNERSIDKVELFGFKTRF